MTEIELTETICKVLDSKKALNIQKIDLQKVSVLADYFVVCSGKSTTQVKALADNLDEEMSKIGIEPIRMEGKQDGKWAVVDYGDVIVHIFHEETRKTYDLEELWNDGQNISAFVE